MGKATFGVYLCHNNELFRKHMWYEIFDITRYAFSKSFIIASFLISVLVFAICTIVDLIRLNMFEKTLFRIRLVNNAINRIDRFINE